MDKHPHYNAPVGLAALAFVFTLGFWAFAPDEPSSSSLLTPGEGAPVASVSATPRDDVAMPPRPLHFVENRGQAPADVRFHAEAAGHTVLLRPDAVVFRRSDPSVARSSEVTLRFVGAASDPHVEGWEPQAGRVHVYRGADPEDWQTDVPTFGGVRYRGLYPGIDLLYHGGDGTLKSNFYVAPGHDPKQIRLRYEGAEAPRLRDDGALVLATPLGEFVEAAPVVYQEVDGRRVAVDARYALHDDGTVGFALGAYDSVHTLVIDPEIVFETSFGGSGFDQPNAIAVAPDGAILLTGYTESNDFPTVNAHDDTRNGFQDIFLTKIDRDTGDLIFSTYLGGTTPVVGQSSVRNEARGLAVDDAGTVYIIGETSASDFPLVDAIQDASAGNLDIVIVRFSPEGELTFSTYLGGTGIDQGAGIALDGTDLWITGFTDTQSGTGFPIVNPLQELPGAFGDAFVAHLEAGAGGAPYDLMFSTYLGGDSGDRGAAIVVDANGDVIVGGSTNSTDFPTVNAVQGTLGGGGDGFMTKVAGDHSAFLYSTYLGGSSFDGVLDVAVNAAGDAYGAGTTASIDFPTLNPAQGELGGEQTAFLSAFASGGSLLFSTYWGGGLFEVGTSVAEQNGMVFLGGATESPDFPLIDPLDEAPHEMPSGFVAGFTAGGAVEISTTVEKSVRGSAVAGNPTEWYYTTERLTDILVGIIGSFTTQQTTLDVTKTVDNEIPDLGDLLTYTMTVTNTGLVDALAVNLRDIYTIEELSYETDNGGCEDDGEELTCELGAIAPGASVSVNAFFRLEALAIDGSVSNEVRVTSANAPPDQAVLVINPRPNITFDVFIAYVALAAGVPSQGLKQVDVIDVYLDDVRIADDVARQASTGTVPVVLGRLTPRIEVVESTDSDNGNPVATFDPRFLVGEGEEAFVPDASALLFVEVEPDSLELLVKHEARTEAEDPAQVDFFLAHAAINAPSFDLRLPDGTVLFDDVAPRGLTGYATLPPAVETFHLTAADGTPEEIFRVDMSGTVGGAVTLALVPVGPSAQGDVPVTLLAFDDDGNRLDVTVVAGEDTATLPAHFVLESNYPNPFRGATVLRFDLPEPAVVSVEVFDMLGRSVLTQTTETMEAGVGRTVPLDAGALPAGVYLYRVVAEGATRTHTQSSRFVRVR